MAQQRPIIVPITDSTASFDALALAGRLARLQKTVVYAVHVIEVTRSLPLNAEMELEARRGENLLRRAEDHARKQDYSLQRELLQSRQAGQAIVDEAHAQHADAIVLGLAYNRAFGELEVGQTAAYVLKHARCRVIVVREAAAE